MGEPQAGQANGKPDCFAGLSPNHKFLNEYKCTTCPWELECRDIDIRRDTTLSGTASGYSAQTQQPPAPPQSMPSSIPSAPLPQSHSHTNTALPPAPVIGSFPMAGPSAPASTPLPAAPAAGSTVTTQTQTPAGTSSGTQVPGAPPCFENLKKKQGPAPGFKCEDCPFHVLCE